MTSLIGAVLAALVAGYLTNFLADDYRRFRDGSAFAAALAGELSSYMQGYEELLPGLEGLLKLAMIGNSVRFPKFEPPRDPIFDSGVGKLGLLGPGIAEDVAFVYQQINAFRTAFQILGSESALSDDQVCSLLSSCQSSINRAQSRGKPLIASLKRRSAAQWSWQEAFAMFAPNKSA